MQYAAGLKRFLLGVAKASAVILVTIVVLIVGFWAVSSHNEKKETEARAPLAVPKKWQTIALEPVDGVRADLMTVWRDGTIYYRFSLTGPSPQLSASRSSTGAAFTIQLLDLHGFELHKQDASLAAMTTIISSEGTPSGYEWQHNETLQENVYRAMASWAIVWRGLAEPSLPVIPEVSSLPRPQPRSPKPLPVAARWKDRSRWRQLSLGMPKEAVEALLGSAGKIVAFPDGSSWWYYGYPTGGQVSFSRKGIVDSWDEP